jgi:hypothetical protein
MDPASLAVLMNALAPVLGALVCLGAPVAIVFTVKHFKLRQRELELDAELHGKQTQARLQAIETRLAALESTLGASGRGAATLQDRLSLLEPPPAAETTAPADPARARTR